MLLTDSMSTNTKSSLVLDIGTATTRCGWAHQEEPEMVMPTLVGRGPHLGAMRHLGLNDTYVGHEAVQHRGILTTRPIMKKGVIQQWDDLQVLWNHVGSQFLSEMNEEDEVRVLVSVPPLFPSKDRRKLTEIILETRGVEGVYLASKSLLAMYGGGRTTGISVDSGEDMTYIVPCWEGTPITSGILSVPLAGKHVTNRLLDQLSHGKYSFPDDNFLLWKKRNMQRITIASRVDVVREAKEQFCWIAETGSAALTSKEEEVLRLLDGNIVVVGQEATSAPEIIFSPGKMNLPGLHDLVYKSVLQCDEKIRAKLLSNIMLTGGNSLLPGMDVRLRKELGKLLSDDDENIRVVAQKGRDNFTWTGGAHLCGLSSFQSLWRTKQDLHENGGCSDINQNETLGNEIYIKTETTPML